MSRGLLPEDPSPSSWDDMFAEAILTIHALLLALARRLSGDWEASEDICQQVYIEFWRRYRTWRWNEDMAVRRVQFYAVLARLVRYRVLDRHRRPVGACGASEHLEDLPEGNALTPHPQRTVVLIGDDVPDKQPGASNEVEAAEMAGIVAMAISTLPRRQCDVLQLKSGGMSISEIAGSLRITEGAVRQALFHGLARLAVLLKPHYPELAQRLEDDSDSE